MIFPKYKGLPAMIIMKPFVVYYSRTGNTRKVAETIADVLGTKARSVRDAEAADVPKGAFIIAGSGVYASRAGRRIMDFLQSLPDVSGGSAAVFETSGDGSISVAGEQMGEVLRKRGYDIRGAFFCRGSVFRIFRRCCPLPEDLERARKFAAGLRKSSK
jgi:flavodoxin